MRKHLDPMDYVEVSLEVDGFIIDQRSLDKLDDKIYKLEKNINILSQALDAACEKIIYATYCRSCALDACDEDDKKCPHYKELRKEFIVIGKRGE